MVFSSITFLIVFLPVFLLVYQWISKPYRNRFILFASILFYSWGAPTFIFVLLLTTLVDFYLVRVIGNSVNESKRKLFLVLSLLLNAGLLVFFKYSDFLIENFNAASSLWNGKSIPLLQLVLPIGISFYTFETVTYVVDVYRRVHKPLKNFWDYQMYIILFPKLIAGPIVRFHTIADQINDRDETIDDKLQGFIRFSIGLGKKVLIANVLGKGADSILSLPVEQLSTGQAWIGILAYTFQIYFDFSGYSDMALGLGRMMGFRFPENFNNPYTSESITDFWRRWHISLGQWMKSYLYIPLGGNRAESKWMAYRNLWIVFVLSGLWHGASWNFVFWGVYHGFFLILDKLFLLNVLKKMNRVFRIGLTFLITCVGWVFFRLEHFGQSTAYVKRLFTWSFVPSSQAYSSQFVAIMILGIVFSFSRMLLYGRRAEAFLYHDSTSLRRYFALMPFAVLLFVLSLSTITTGDFNPFIYFRF